jgi:hypothetical protein
MMLAQDKAKNDAMAAQAKAKSTQAYAEKRK